MRPRTLLTLYPSVGVCVYLYVEHVVFEYRMLSHTHKYIQFIQYLLPVLRKHWQSSAVHHVHNGDGLFDFQTERKKLKTWNLSTAKAQNGETSQQSISIFANLVYG